MARCQICGKGNAVGRQSRHHRGVASHKFAHRAPRKRKVFAANIQKTTVRVGGLKLTMKLCTRCLKKMHSEQGKILAPMPAKQPATEKQVTKEEKPAKTPKTAKKAGKRTKTAAK